MYTFMFDLFEQEYAKLIVFLLSVKYKAINRSIFSFIILKGQKDPNGCLHTLKTSCQWSELEVAEAELLNRILPVNYATLSAALLYISLYPA